MSGIRYDVIVPAAGQSARFGNDKLLARLNGKTVIESSVAPFLADANCQKIVLMAGHNEALLRPFFANNDKVVVIKGSSDRQKTVLTGLQTVTNDHVLIHDGARPFLTKELLDKVLLALANSHACIPVIPSSDSVMQVNQKDGTLLYLDRSSLRLVQTPQGFQTARLREAFEIMRRKPQLAAGVHGEEGSLYLAAYGSEGLTLVEGDSANRKITYPRDLVPAL